MKKLLSLVLALIILMVSASVCFAEVKADTKSTSASETDYSFYLEKHNKLETNVDTVFADLETVIAKGGANVKQVSKFEGKASVLKWNNTVGEATFTFDVPKTGLYNVAIEYFPLDTDTEAIDLSLLVDDKEVFKGLNNISLPRLYIDDGEIRSDGMGNQFAPEQKEYFTWQEKRLCDAEGLNAKPYLLALTKGEHTITIYNTSAPFAIASIKLCAEEKVPTYAEVLKTYEAKGYKKYEGNQITIQGEDAYLKSAFNLISQSDATSANVYPYDAEVAKVNYIGGNNWSGAGDTISWQLDVPEDGLYAINFAFQQSYIINGSAYRILRVDGEIPFAEAAEIDFKYCNAWKIKEFGEKEGEPYLIYLKKGTRTLSLEVNLCCLSNFAVTLKNQIYDLGAIYREIVMITGENPDPNRDYALFSQIPDLEERLNNSHKVLSDLIVEADSLSEKGSSGSTSTLKNMVAVIERMLEYKYQAQTYKSSFFDNYSSLSAWLYEIISMPLDLDAIYVTAPTKEVEHLGGSFWEKLLFGFKRFFFSMTSDYNSISGDVDKEGITLWVNWGRDQVQVLNYLAQSDFTAKTGIGVEIKMTNATLIQGLLSGNGPDCYLHMSRTEPVNLAMRGGLYDLTQFDDYEEVTKRFMKSASVPYTYNGGVYALPDTQTFSIMYYRKDVLDELGLEVPQTWDDFIAASAVIMRNNMQVGLPYTQITDMNQVNQGLGALNIYPTLLMQKGVDLYDKDLTSINLTSEEAVNTFTMWTDFYNKYSFPKTYDFYNRFRTGLIPLAVQSCAQYTTISAAASEIRGLWGVSLIPGFKDENGNINRTQAGAGSGCAILKSSDNIKGAWEFLKWWTSDEIQLKYSQNIESILGITGRNMTANVNALSRLSWNDGDFEILKEQWELVNEMPEVPGGYYIPRVVDQAFWNVVGNGKGIEEMLLKWDKVADTEIAEKRSQYN
ncbi:MAG: extracellular solute-binding protein [Clostridia bacterium]|nr:extracellular solute-binding protein [Clostridia bacterium]